MANIDREVLREIVNRYFRRKFNEVEGLAVNAKMDDFNSATQFADWLNETKSTFSNRLAQRDYSEVEDKATSLFESEGLSQLADKFDHAKMCNFLLSCHVDLLDALAKREKRDIEGLDAILKRYPVSSAGLVMRENKGTPVVLTPPTESQITFYEMIDCYCDYKINVVKKWKGRSVQEQPKRFKVLKMIVGDVPVSSINAETALKVFECLQKVPTRLDSKKYQGKTLEQLMALKDAPRLSAKSVNMNMDLASGLFKYAVQFDHAEKNYFEGMRITDEVADEDKRPPFSKEDIKLLFGPPFKRFATKPSRFWLPTFGLFTGGRLEELAQLHVADVYEESGILVLDFNSSGIKRLKNKSSKRKIPVHNYVRYDLGFEKYVRKVKRLRHERLFPELPYRQQRFGHAFSGEFRAYLNKIGIGDGKTFHSFRHTFIDHLRNQNVRDELIASVTGHKQSQKSPIPQNYTPQQQMDFLMKEVIEHVEFDKLIELN
ncbi:MAG: site-specific integrase [Desulfovibrio sp.]